MRWPFEKRHRIRDYHVGKMEHDGDKSSVFLVEREGPGHERAAVKLYKSQYDRLALQIEKKYGIPSEGEAGLRLNPQDGRPHKHYPIVLTIRHGREFDRRNGRRYLVQEFVEGVALKGLVSCRDARVARYPAAFIVQCCQALRIVHRAGFVHRDICSQNLIVQPDYRVKLIDLGFVAPAGIAFPECSGTPSYMPPEQIRGEPLHPTSDIYSVGILMHELLRARLPFRSRIEGDDDRSVEARRQEILQKHLTDEVPELPEAVRQRRPVLSALMTRCLDKDPAGRPQSTDEIINALTGRD
jgi:serine/threonine-protein kinase